MDCAGSNIVDYCNGHAGTHIFHAFTPEWVDDWKGLDSKEYEKRKVQVTGMVHPILAWFQALLDVLSSSGCLTGGGWCAR